uniref:Uncharacterized protein n=1 Tax=Magallana gigas TaxID=29159 RepID=K1PUI0_MAGGI
MTSTLDLEIWFKVTAHSLPKGTLLVKYESDRAKGRENMLWTSNLRWTEGHKDGQTDAQTDHYKAPAERGTNS